MTWFKIGLLLGENIDTLEDKLETMTPDEYGMYVVQTWLDSQYGNWAYLRKKLKYIYPGHGELDQV